MKKTIIFCFLALLVLGFNGLYADGFDELTDLAEESSEEFGLDDLGDLNENSEESFEDPSFSINFGGYLKGLAYWNQEEYSELLWDTYYPSIAAQGRPIPQAQKINGYNNIGTRMQLKVEAFLEDKARLFSAFNVNFNTASSIHDQSSDINESQVGDIRQVETFVEIFEGSRTWKIGSQIVTWGFLEGIEVPTDRVNARDYSYKSTEYEDGKLASTGVLLTQNLWDSALDIFYIPIARKNINMEFQEYLYPETTVTETPKPNNGKWATRFSGALGNLDYALSYVEGKDVAPDLVGTVGTGIFAGKLLPTERIHKTVKSPGLDLQYNFGSFLVKASYINNLTEDEEGDDYFVKNNWNKYLAGVEFTAFGSTVNLYAGQHVVENFKDDDLSEQTNFLLGQFRERTDFMSGHINANFLEGDALNLVLLAAGYWDKEGDPVQTNIKATFKYKVADGLDLVFSPAYMDLLHNIFTDYQFEVKYSF